MSVSFTNTGVGLSANIANVASAAAQLWYKGQYKVDQFRALNTFSGAGLVAIDSDGAGTGKKFESWLQTDGSGNFVVNVKGWQNDSSGGGAGSTSTAITQLPANGGYIVIGGEYNQTNFIASSWVYDSGGGAFVVQSAPAQNSGNMATPGSNGRVTINKAFNANGPTQGLICCGFALYTGAAPAAGNALRYQAPTTGDTNIVAMWKLSDAFSGTSPSTASASVGGQGLVLTTSQYTWSALGLWFPPPAVPPPPQPIQSSRIANQQSRW